jgi:hypothetical protein
VSCTNKRHFEFSYENGATSSFLVIKANGEEQVQAYQIDMIRNNYIDYLLPLDVRRNNDKVCFYYNITSKITLTQYLKRVKLKKEEFLKFIGDVSRALLDCRYYLLKSSSILLDTDYIFINPSTRTVSFVYIPLCVDLDINQYLRQFIIDFILNKADIDDSCNDNFLQRVLGYAKTEMFNVGGFDALIKSMSAVIEADSDGGVTDIPIVSNADLTASCKQLHEQAKIPDKNSSRGDVSGQNEKSCFKAKPVIATALLQVIAAVAFILGISLLKANDRGETASYAALALILAAVDALIIKKMFGSNAVVIKKIEDIDNKTQLEMPIWEKSDKDDANKVADEQSEGVPPLKENLCPEQSYETTLLVQPESVFPYLKSIEDGKFENIIINKPDFIIGRLKEHVDFVVSNNAIGKVHVNITNHDGKYFIKDLNSKNGTFINDKRITSNVEYEINNRDKVSFASSEYIFIIP